MSSLTLYPSRNGTTSTALRGAIWRSVIVIGCWRGVMPRSLPAAAPLAGQACGPVAPLVVGDGGQPVAAAGGPPLPLLPLQAQQVHGAADLLQRQLRIFPPLSFRRILGESRGQKCPV